MASRGALELPFVVTRNLSFTWTGKTVDIRQVWRKLDVSYVLEAGIGC